MAYENAARKVPFRLSADGRSRARNFLLALTLVCAGLHPAIAAAPTSKFLQLGEAERYWWYEGAFRMVAHVIALQDRAKGECAADWYLKDRERKQRVIEKAIADSPQLGETSIIIALLQKACGPLVSK